MQNSRDLENNTIFFATRNSDRRSEQSPARRTKPYGGRNLGGKKSGIFLPIRNWTPPWHSKYCVQEVKRQPKQQSKKITTPGPRSSPQQWRRAVWRRAPGICVEEEWGGLAPGLPTLLEIAPTRVPQKLKKNAPTKCGPKRPPNVQKSWLQRLKKVARKVEKKWPERLKKKWPERLRKGHPNNLKKSRPKSSKKVFPKVIIYNQNSN